MRCLGIAVCTALTLLPGVSLARATPLPSTCLVANGFNEETASASLLQACGITRVPLSNTETLADGGTVYQYQLPDGSLVSCPATPPGFDGATASASEDAQYGLSPRPAMVSASYITWAKQASTWRLDPGANPYIYVDDADRNPKLRAHPVSGRIANSGTDAGYDNTPGGWTRAQVEYTEPTLGVTNCSNPAVSMWAGVGATAGASGSLGQDGTADGEFGGALHAAWYEVVPNGGGGGAIQFQYGGSPMYVSAGDSITALTQWSSPVYEFTLIDGSRQAYADVTSSWTSSTSAAQEVVERPIVNGARTPLLNFKSVTMSGYNGQVMSPIANHPYGVATMPGYASLSALSGATFTVTHQSC